MARMARINSTAIRLATEAPTFRRTRHFMAAVAAGLVVLGGPDEDDGIVVVGGRTVNQALRAAGGPAADHTDGIELCDLLRQGHEHRHGAEGHAPEVQIQPGRDHPLAVVDRKSTRLNSSHVRSSSAVSGWKKK